MGKRFDIKPRTGWQLAVLYLSLLFNPFYILINELHDDGISLFSTVLYIFFGFAALLIIITIIGIIIMHRKPRTLHIYDSSLELYGSTIAPESVEAILIHGYFRPAYGLKPPGPKTLPPTACFRLRNNRDADACTEALEQWAAQYNIPVKYKAFSSWL